MNRSDTSESECKIGAELEDNQQHSAALSHYKAAIDLDPSETRYWIAFGACLTALRHWDQAIKALMRGLELKPHYAEADARMILADALRLAGRVRDAGRQWEIVSQMQPGYPSYDVPIEEAKRRLNGSA